VLGRTSQSQLFDNTTQSAPLLTDANGNATGVLRNSGPIVPERAHVVDAGFVQQLLPQCPTAAGATTTNAPPAANCPSLEVGADIYYRRVKDLLDDGQFGQVLALTAFNYEKAENWGVELMARYRFGNFSAD
jgi:outer membrane receptor protein involved in Fe transport